MKRSACLLIATSLILNFSAQAFAAEGSADPIEIKVDQYKEALKLNQLLRGLAGAAHALTTISLKGNGDIDYWIRDVQLKQAGLVALANWILASLEDVRDPALKVALRSIAHSINGLGKGYGDLHYWAARSTQFARLATEYSETLDELRDVADQNLDQLNLSTQARYILENDRESFASVMTEDMKSTLAQLESSIESNTAKAEQAESAAQAASDKLHELQTNVDVMRAKLDDTVSKFGTLKENLDSVNTQIQAIRNTAMRGQDRVEFNGLDLVSRAERFQLRDQLNGEAMEVLRSLRAKAAEKANIKYPFNPNMTLTFDLKKSRSKNYRFYRLRRGIHQVLAEGIVRLEISDGVHKSNVEHDFSLSYYPKNGKLNLDLRRFLEHKAEPELKVLLKLSAGTAKYEDVLKSLEAKLSDQCETLLGSIEEK